MCNREKLPPGALRQHGINLCNFCGYDKKVSDFRSRNEMHAFCECVYLLFSFIPADPHGSAGPL